MVPNWPDVLSYVFDLQRCVVPTVQDRKTNSFIRFLGESAAQQFCFEIYWLLKFFYTCRMKKVVILIFRQNFVMLVIVMYYLLTFLLKYVKENIFGNLDSHLQKIRPDRSRQKKTAHVTVSLIRSLKALKILNLLF
jgi:cytosine/uracil/thiamine/allantoin permease